MKKASTTGIRNFKGTLVSLRLSANDNSDGLSIIEHRMPHGEATPLHIHRNEDEVFHILSGTMRFEIGGSIVVAHGGDVLCAPKGVAHRFVVESPEGAHCLTIMRGTDFETMVLEMSEPAATEHVPPVQPPTADMIAALAAACSRNGIDIIGPPLAA
ncbi:MAG: cupin domain-containing protein [Rhizobiales bacterium]|nr:cupin domain-containing protein [Hyphomicrobiales bacterium]